MFKNFTIIISSHLSEIEDKIFLSHLQKTVGVKNIEILLYKNNNEFSLSEIYNRGLNESNNEICLFIHNDIIFEQPNWGKKLLNHFNNNEHGILGIAGTTDLHKDGMWWSRRNRMIGSLNHINNGKKELTKYSNKYDKEIIDVCIVDGVFIAVNKSLLKSNFDEEFKGFHFYDISFCVSNYIDGVKIGVIFDIEITHKSIGSLNEKWFVEKNKFLFKYDNYLPINHPISMLGVNKSKINIKNKPKTSLVILHKDNNKILFKLLESIYSHDTSNVNIIIGDTGSSKENLDELLNIVCNLNNLRVIEYNYYNFAKINNHIVKNHVDSDTELIIFCNNDIELVNNAINIITDTYVKNKNSMGTVGCRLHYPDNSIQHSSIICIEQDKKYHLTHYGHKSNYTYYSNNIKNRFGNTAALMGTPYNLYMNIGGFNENYNECFEDVEYNLQCILKNKNNFHCGEAVAYHHESITRNMNPNKNILMEEDYLKINDFIKTNSRYFTNYIINYLN